MIDTARPAVIDTARPAVIDTARPAVIDTASDPSTGIEGDHCASPVRMGE
ncbi:hypothetical protein [Halorubrum salsamenti]|nr:hypothetical protein [Halorubrum salsamenti]